MLDLTSITFTALFNQWRSGDREAGEELFRLIYNDLLKIARSSLRNDRVGEMIDPTTLVHEAYLRLFGKQIVDVTCRAHFFAIATRQMRRILIELARKNGGIKINTRLDTNSAEHLAAASPIANIDLIALDDALTELEKIDGRACQAVELRFFGGLTELETAELLGVSVATLKRDWTFAKTWLYRRLQ
jgi:RNA polymerase sigma-70 factor, ECF subfamily